MHPQAPLLACASAQQAIRVYNINTEEMLNNIRYHDGFMGQKIGPTKCLAFHPHKVSTTLNFRVSIVRDEVKLVLVCLHWRPRGWPQEEW